MDLNNIQNQISNLTLYDLKAGVRKVQNGNAFNVNQSAMLMLEQLS